jgi:hypothetical protein
MLIRKLIFLGLLLCLSFQVSLQAQTYATPELKRQADAEMAAKILKIQKDPEAYRAQGGIPEDFLKTNTVEKPAPIFYAPPVDAKRPDLYKLTAIDAVDLYGKHTASQMKAFQAEAEAEFTKTNMVLDWKNQTWYFIPRDLQKEPGKKEFQLEKDLLQFTDCRPCQDNTFTIAEQTENVLTLYVKPQDAEKFFVFSLTFKK